MFWLIPLLLLLILIGIPIAFALGFVSVVGIILSDVNLLINVPRKIFAGIDSFTLVAVPLFIFAGEIMTKGGISKRLINFSQTLVGHMSGGLAMVVVLASMFFFRFNRDCHCSSCSDWGHDDTSDDQTRL